MLKCDASMIAVSHDVGHNAMEKTVSVRRDGR